MKLLTSCYNFHNIGYNLCYRGYNLCYNVCYNFRNFKAEPKHETNQNLSDLV